MQKRVENTVKWTEEGKALVKFEKQQESYNYNSPKAAIWKIVRKMQKRVKKAVKMVIRRQNSGVT